MLPNADGSDEGNEYIEFYNPNNVEVDLSNYVFYIGDDSLNSYSFPPGSRIGANEYLSFLNYEIKFTLVNNSSSVRLYSKDGFMINESATYANSDDDMSWALIDGVW